MSVPLPGARELEIFRELVAIPSPTGREQEMAAAVRARVAALGLESRTDGAGNVTVRIEGREAALGTMILASHMDEISLVVTAVTGDGALLVERSGGLFPHKIGEGPVEVLGDGGRATGVLSLGSVYGDDGEDAAPRFADARIITGLTAEALADLGVRPGSTAVPCTFRRGPLLLGDPDDPLVAAWTFDNRMGVVTLLRLLEETAAGRLRPRRPTVVAFTVHEEIGCHGAKVLAHRERPEIFVAVDACPIPPGSPLEIDGRPGVWSMDTVAHSDQGLVAALCDAAIEAGTSLQVAVYESAASEASKVFDAGAAERTVAFGPVRENSHGFEVARLSVFANVLATLVRFVEDI